MHRHFYYYDNWRTEELTCPICEWIGTFEQGLNTYRDELMESSCPKCDDWSTPVLAIVSYPTIEESEQNWNRLTDDERQRLDIRKRQLAHFQSVCLKEVGQLPDLNGSELVLTWDLEHQEDGQHLTNIRHGETIIWREPARWEGYERFEEILVILKKKYGKHLRDLVPTKTSALYLHGDRLWTPEAVQRLRQELE